MDITAAIEQHIQLPASAAIWLSFGIQRQVRPVWMLCVRFISVASNGSLMS